MAKKASKSAPKHVTPKNKKKVASRRAPAARAKRGKGPALKQATRKTAIKPQRRKASSAGSRKAASAKPLARQNSTKAKATRGTKAPPRGLKKKAPKPRAKRKVSPAKGKNRKPAVSATKARRQPAVAKIRRDLDIVDQDLLRSTKTNPQHHRLAPGERHTVEEDEKRERDGSETRAFVGTHANVDEAKQRGEEFVRTATSGEAAESDLEEEEATEEEGGPFLITTGRTEFASGTDASNPRDAERSPFPSVSPKVNPIAPDDSDDAGEDEGDGPIEGDV